ncbi:hypothetical protein ACVMB1_001764 [Bradyrhizobium sp. USDA 4504]
MKSLAASNWALCFRRPSARRTSSRPSTFVFGRLVQVGYPEAGEIFGIALSLFPSPVQIALEQAAAAVVNVNVRVRRPVHDPGRLCRPSHRDFVDHPHAPSDRIQSLPTQRDGKSFQFSPNLRPLVEKRSKGRSESFRPRVIADPIQRNDLAITAPKDGSAKAGRRREQCHRRWISCDEGTQLARRFSAAGDQPAASHRQSCSPQGTWTLRVENRGAVNCVPRVRRSKTPRRPRAVPEDMAPSKLLRKK